MEKRKRFSPSWHVIVASATALFVLTCLARSTLSTAKASVDGARVIFGYSDIPLLTTAIDCGDVCRYDLTIEKPSVHRVVPLSLNCKKVFLRMLSKCPAVTWPPPEDIPPNLFNAYTMGGRIPVRKQYFNSRYSGGKAAMTVWSEHDLRSAVTAPELYPTSDNLTTYGRGEGLYFENAVREFTGAVRGGVGIVWGSEKPWVEVILARAGAKHVVTVEYGEIESTHRTFIATTPDSFAAFMLLHERSFDFAATFSSLEHSGLGRYGDSLDPYGDLQAAAETLCALRPGGYFFLGLPSADPLGVRDELVWNAHRFYGHSRLGQIFRGFEYIKTMEVGQTGAEHSASLIHILRKPMTP